MNVSILVPAHNESSNIETVLSSLLEQVTDEARIVEVIVVASGCTDDTADIARSVGRGRPGMHVVIQERRAGKVAAINEYLRVRNPRAEIIVSCSADLRVAPDVVERIVKMFRERPEIGMIGARPHPDNDRGSFMGRVVNVLWEMHHRVALAHPKMGELVAFRADLVESVSELSVVDEASIEDVIRSKGYTLGYEPDAIVTNHGPETWKEYFEQRRRIARGHYWLDFAFGYQVATLDRALLVTTALGVLREEDSFGRMATMAAVGTEVLARMAGFWDARVRGGKHRTWKQLESTKTLRNTHVPPPPPASTARIKAGAQVRGETTRPVVAPRRAGAKK
jgi:cellulose synthase/poly-beta-1,6-N-acetylglucosamine synthase-like glycosyltransferase